MATCQLPGEFGIGLDLGRVSSAPVSSVRFWTTYGELALGLRLLVDAALVEELGGLGQPAGERLLERRLLVEQLELEQRGLADQRLGALGVLDARELDEDAVVALPRDGRLGDAELVDAVADRLHPLAHGEVAQLGSLWSPIASGKRPAAWSSCAARRRRTRRRPSRASFQWWEASSTTIALVALARHPLDADALALERRS